MGFEAENAGVSEPAGLPARLAAQSILGDVLHKRRPLDSVLAGLSDLAPRDAGFARAIASETLRRLGQLDALVHHFVPKLPPPHRAGATFEILLAGACELLFLEVAPHAAVDAANRLAQHDTKAVHFKPLINAVLRRAAREGAETLSRQDAPRLNTPDWLWSRWQSTYGEETARAISHAHLAPAPLDIVLKDEKTPNDLVPPGERLFTNVVRMPPGQDVERLPGFAGSWWVQDLAASLPVRLFGDVRGRVVLDLCAAPGGKTMQLASQGAQVIAVDRDGARMDRVRRNLARVGLEAALVAEDVRDFRPQEPAPFVLLDAPCSATGTIRRHPDLPWIKGASDVTLCAATAAELLENAAEMTARGGLLVFAVCSLEPEEGAEQVEAFLANNQSFVRKPIEAVALPGLGACISDAGDLRTLPCHLASKGGMDGFYAVRLRRVS
jgi:16S rRNA (cytosine967-C5)-methyltransferase